MTAWNKVPVFLEATPPGFLWQHPAQLDIVKKKPQPNNPTLSCLTALCHTGRLGLNSRGEFYLEQRYCLHGSASVSRTLKNKNKKQTTQTFPCSPSVICDLFFYKCSSVKIVKAVTCTAFNFQMITCHISHTKRISPVRPDTVCQV